MEPRHITPDYAVSPQIAPEDVPAIAASGFTRIVCNRPDAEVPPALQSDAVQTAAEAVGLEFVDNPFSHAAFGIDLIDRQDAARSEASGPVFAYCASGNRCAVLWAFGAVRAGEVSPEEAVMKAAEAGYDLSGLKPQLDTLVVA